MLFGVWRLAFSVHRFPRALNRFKTELTFFNYWTCINERTSTAVAELLEHVAKIQPRAAPYVKLLQLYLQV